MADLETGRADIGSWRALSPHELFRMLREKARASPGYVDEQWERLERLLSGMWLSWGSK